MLPLKDNSKNELASYCTRTTKKTDDGRVVITRECGYTFKKPFQNAHSEIDEILPIRTGVVKEDECLRLRSSPLDTYCTCSTHLCNHSNKIESLSAYFLLFSVIIKIIYSAM